MSAVPLVERDERTVAVANAGYKWACILLMYALLVDVMYRGIVRQEAAWDLLAFVIAGGAVCLIHQVRHRTLPRGWGWKAVLIACLSGAIAAIVGVVLAMTQAM